MKITKKQQLQLRTRGYKPEVRRLNLYPAEDFSSGVWDEVKQCLNIDDCDSNDVPYMVDLVIVGVKTYTSQS